MKKVNERLKGLFSPQPALLLLLTAASACGLSWVFWNGKENSPQAYLIYVLSAYWLCACCVRAVPLCKKLLQHRREREAAERSLTETEKEKKRKRAFFRSLAINLAFAAFKMALGVWYASTWLVTVGIYYIALSTIRFVFVRFELKIERTAEPARKQLLGWNAYQLCGYLLLMLNLTMTGMVFQMIWRGMGGKYPELAVYAVAAYTFYKLTISIMNVFRSRKNTSPILAAARNLDLSVALMSLFTLQTAMFSAFGGDWDYQYLMNSITGGAVCFLVVCGALGMVLHGRKMKQRLNGGIENGRESVL